MKKYVYIYAKAKFQTPKHSAAIGVPRVKYYEKKKLRGCYNTDCATVLSKVHGIFALVYTFFKTLQTALDVHISI